MMRAILPVALLLAACSGGDQARYEDAGQPSAKDNAAAAAIENSVVENGATATAQAGAPVVPPTPGLAERHILPAGFQGYWGRTRGDCDLANVGATGRLNIEEDVLRFYESKARVDAMTIASPADAMVELAFTGEGEKWSRRSRLTLEAGGTRLVRRDERAAPVQYQHC